MTTPTSPNSLASAGERRAEGAREPQQKTRTRIIVSDVIHAAARVSCIPTARLLGPERDHEVVVVRQAAVWVARKLTDVGLVPMGLRFNRDHSTLVNSVRCVRLRLQRGDDRTRDLVARITGEAGEVARARLTGRPLPSPEPPKPATPPPAPAPVAASPPPPPPKPLVAAGEVASRARVLRRKGWSITGIARYLGVEQEFVVGALGEGSLVA